jgi:DeoR family fructose operon transcriptional repressor
MYETRKKYIMQQLDVKGHLNVKDLREKLEVSAMTVHRDLTKMEEEGLIIKGFGEIAKVKGIYLDQLMAKEEQDYPECQRAIARFAKTMVGDGDTVIFGNGNIIFELTKQIKDRKIVSVTPSLRAALALNKGNGSVYMTGGLLSNDAKCLYGEYAEHVLQSFYADKAFITCATLNAYGEICEYKEEEVRLKRLIFKHAKKTILLLENEKMGINKFFKAGDLNNISMVLTDEMPSESFLKLFQEHGVTVKYLD